MKYLKLFSKDADYQAYKGGGQMILPNVSYVIETNSVAYNSDKKPLIKFYVDDVEYTAEEGMTWYEWCYSDYNTLGAYTLYAEGNEVYLFERYSNDAWGGGEYKLIRNVYSENIIESNYQYDTYLDGYGIGGGFHDEIFPQFSVFKYDNKFNYIYGESWEEFISRKISENGSSEFSTSDNKVYYQNTALVTPLGNNVKPTHKVLGIVYNEETVE